MGDMMLKDGENLFETRKVWRKPSFQVLKKDEIQSGATHNPAGEVTNKTSYVAGVTTTTTTKSTGPTGHKYLSKHTHTTKKFHTNVTVYHS